MSSCILSPTGVSVSSYENLNPRIVCTAALYASSQVKFDDSAQLRKVVHARRVEFQSVITPHATAARPHRRFGDQMNDELPTFRSLLTNTSPETESITAHDLSAHKSARIPLANGRT